MDAVVESPLDAPDQARAARCNEGIADVDRRCTLDDTAELVVRVKAEAGRFGRQLGVYTVGVVTCRATAKEAEEYYRHCVFDNADWAAVDKIMAMRGVTREKLGDAEFERVRRHTANGLSGLPLIGDPDSIAADLAKLSGAGLSGIGISMVNYADELPFFCDEVLPRLERLGVRASR